MQKMPAGLAPVIYIPSLVYETILRVRNGLYTASLLPRRRLPAPVISVGNITVGGTGKTPLVIYIAQRLRHLGYNPAVLTRGYGRIDAGRIHILSPEEAAPMAPRILGDEPALIRRRAPEASLGIASNRFRAGAMIARRLERAVFILDDGFQHRRLWRDLDIVVIDSSRSLTADRVFPRGTLREPLSGLRRCDLIIVNDTHDGAATVRSLEVIRHCHPSAMVFRCRQSIRALVPFSAWTEGELSKNSVPSSAFLVAAVGNPGRFEQDIRALGIEVRGAKFFRDHAWLTPNDWADCIEQARRKGAGAIILTEKDAIKLSSPPDFPMLVAIQSTDMADAAGFEQALKHCIEERT